MEIQKIFSDLEGGEKLYSVLMSEEELSLFSELIQKEFGFDTRVKPASNNPEGPFGKVAKRAPLDLKIDRRRLARDLKYIRKDLQQIKDPVARKNAYQREFDRLAINSEIAYNNWNKDYPGFFREDYERITKNPLLNSEEKTNQLANAARKTKKARQDYARQVRKSSHEYKYPLKNRISDAVLSIVSPTLFGLES